GTRNHFSHALLQEDVIDGDAYADHRKDHCLQPHSRIVLKKRQTEENDKGVHEYALVPAKIAGHKSCYFREDQAACCGGKRQQKTNLGIPLPKERLHPCTNAWYKECDQCQHKCNIGDKCQKSEKFCDCHML